MSCNCNSINEIASGGITCGGSATITDTTVTISGGAVCSGSALVSIVGLSYDGLACVYPLDDDGPTFLDHSPNSLDGTGGITDPVLSSGVFCLGSNYFEESEDTRGCYIRLPEDPLDDDPFTVTFWVKMDSKYRHRTFYSRGLDGPGSTWAFSIGHSYLNHLMVSIHQSDYTTVECYSATRLSVDRWYHCAAVYDGSNVSVYINGVLENNQSCVMRTPSGGGFIGRLNHGSYPTCYMQELRLYGGVKSEAWLLAEYQNFCSGLVTVGTPTAPPTEYDEVASGGVVTSGTSTMLHELRPILTGGMVTGGEATVDVASAPLLLDAYTGASAAYSLRLLSNSYAGSAIRVRRSSDNTETDIGFVGGDLDTAALSTFSSKTTSYVTKWYDQSGNANDAVMTTTSLQPEIITGPTTYAFGSGKSILFTADSLLSPVSVNPGSCTVFMAWRPTDVLNRYTAIAANVGTPQNDFAFGNWDDSVDGQVRVHRGGTGCRGGALTINDTLKTYVMDTSSQNLYDDMSLVETNTLTGGTAQTIDIGSGTTGYLPMNGRIAELIIYPSAVSTDRPYIEHDIMSYYGLTIPAVGLGDETNWWIPSRDPDGNGTGVMTNYGSDASNTCTIAGGDITIVADTDNGGSFAVSFPDGNDTGVCISPATPSGTDFTWACWLDPTTSASARTFLSQNTGFFDSGACYVYTQNSNIVWNFASTTVTMPFANDGSWVHVCLTYNVTTHVMTGYINGVSAGTPATKSAQTISSEEIKIGQTYIGLMDDIRIYDRIITSGEISHLASGRAAFATP